MQKKLAEAEAKCNYANLKAVEYKEKAVSEELQRKALNERMQDVNSRVAQLEADHEQFELENKSLLNKLKVCQVKMDDADVYREEIVRLKSEINDLRLKNAKIEDIEQLKSEIERLTQLNGTMVEASKITEIEDEYKLKSSISNELLNELRSDASQKQVTINAMTEELTKSSEALENLKIEIEKLTQENATLQ